MYCEGSRTWLLILQTGLFSVHQAQYSSIALPALNFLKGRYSEEVEDSTHAVNDALFEVIQRQHNLCRH